MYNDTIVAIATPPGEGGIGIVRLSGAAALTIGTRIFHPLHAGPLRPYRMRYGWITDPADGHVVDEALAVYMRTPRSFTGEDVVEFSCHGGPLPLQQTLSLALAAGARLATPGEFTLRAFLSGRIDLTQAEATLDVIRARTDAGLALAQQQLAGWLAKEVRRIRAELIEILAYVTVCVDFPEDEVEAQELGPQLGAALAAVEALLKGADQGMIYRQGARAALVGRPNVGKSSLLNALLRADRAIVTAIAGTTRDTLEETANLAGIPVVLIDTAGITESSNLIEQLGIERSRSALAGADLALLVFDAGVALSDDDLQIAALTVDRPTLVVWNKADTLPNNLPLLPFIHPKLVGSIQTSALTHAGVEALAQAIARVLLGGAAPITSDARLVANPRHRDALLRAVEHLRATVATRQVAAPTDLLAGDLTTALNALGEITGETVGADLLEVIFSRFCIGK